jgi:hypothetical protein
MAAAVISPCLATTDCRCTLQIGQTAKRRNCRGQPVGIGNRDGVALDDNQLPYPDGVSWPDLHDRLPTSIA